MLFILYKIFEKKRAHSHTYMEKERNVLKIFLLSFYYFNILFVAFCFILIKNIFEKKSVQNTFQWFISSSLSFHRNKFTSFLNIIHYIRTANTLFSIWIKKLLHYRDWFLYCINHFFACIIVWFWTKYSNIIIPTATTTTSNIP